MRLPGLHLCLGEGKGGSQRERGKSTPLDARGGPKVSGRNAMGSKRAGGQKGEGRWLEHGSEEESRGMLLGSES